MEIDKELIHAKIDIIEQDMKVLKDIGSMSIQELKENYRDVLAAKHALQESVEACLDMGNHVISARGFRRPEDYKDIFRILSEENIIKKDFSENLERMAKFRNLLVHRYQEIETEKLHKILESDINDIDKFVKIIIEYIKKE